MNLRRGVEKRRRCRSVAGGGDTHAGFLTASRRRCLEKIFAAWSNSHFALLDSCEGQSARIPGVTPEAELGGGCQAAAA
jgi:hypothetical protein